MVKSLNITGFASRPVPNQFIENDDNANTLAIIFPGGGYTTAMPLLYYATELSLQRGWDVLLVNYAYPHPGGNLSTEEYLARLDVELKADTDAAAQAGLRHREYNAVAVFGKSLGTIAMASVTSRLTNIEHRLIWLTPLVKRDDVRKAIEAEVLNSMFIIGTADSHYDASIVNDLCRQEVRGVVIEGADHSMDVRGGIDNSISVLGSVFQEVEEFLVEFPDPATQGLIL